MPLGLQYLHVVIFVFLLAYIDAYFFLILFFTCADNEQDEDEFELDAEELHEELVDYLINTGAINPKGSDFNKSKFLLDNINVTDDTWEYYVDLWEIPELSDETLDGDFLDPSYDFEGQANSFYLNSFQNLNLSSKCTHKQSTSYFFLTHIHLMRKKKHIKL